jgi:hypothetical protein
MKHFLGHILVLFLVSLSPVAFGHKSSDSYLRISSSNQVIAGEWHIAVRDLANVLDLDTNNDLGITWGELKQQQKEIQELAFSSLALETAQQRISIQIQDFLIDRHTDGGYAVLRFTSSQPVGDRIRISYDLFFEMDAQHRGILFLEGGHTPAHVFKPEARSYDLALAPGGPAPKASFASFVAEGVWHIWKGFDHLLFLLTLILPTVVRREGSEWRVASNFQPVLLEVAKVVTAFTLAHSITLALAALRAVILPSALVESVIAASVVVAAVNNLRPFLHGKGWMLAFGFGLVHGFGFASVFADLGVAQAGILAPLLAFNVGVELGQLAVVAAFLPIAFLFRTAPAYRLLAVQGGSAAVALVAATWTLERALHFKFLPF